MFNGRAGTYTFMKRILNLIYPTSDSLRGIQNIKMIS